jgi:hypothetical protein
MTPSRAQTTRRCLGLCPKRLRAEGRPLTGIGCGGNVALSEVPPGYPVDQVV